MMKKTLTWKEKTHNVQLSFSLQGEKGKGLLVAKSSINCDCRGGKLRKAPAGAPCLKEDGTLRVCNVSDVVRIYLLKEYDATNGSYVERFAVLGKTGLFFIQMLDTQGFTLHMGGIAGAEAVRVADGNKRSKIVFISGSACMFLDSNYVRRAVTLENTCKTGTFFKHRLFVGVKPAGLACNAPGNELDFTQSVHGGGLLHFPCVGGEIVSVRAFGDKLYVFFEYGILRLTIGGAIKDFKAEEVEYVGGKIYGRTVCVLNNAIFFMASDGLYRFDGKAVNRLFSDFVQLPQEETFYESGVAYLDKALLRYMTVDGYKTLAVYEDGKDCFYMDGLNALSGEDGSRCLFINESNLICQLTEDGKIGGKGEFSGAETDFGISGRKTLTKLSFTGKGNVSMTVENGGRTFTRSLAFEEGRAEVKLSERGEKFTFYFTLSRGSEISSAVAEIKTLV